MPDYTKGGVTYNANQYNGATNEATIIALAPADPKGTPKIQKVGHETLMVITPVGPAYAKRGDWVLKRAVTGTLFVEKRDIFPSGYVIVP